MDPSALSIQAAELACRKSGTWMAGSGICRCYSSCASTEQRAAIAQLQVKICSRQYTALLIFLRPD